MFLLQILDLFGFQPGEAEHADLVDDVVPVSGNSLDSHLGKERFSHLLDASRHCLNVFVPFLTKSQIVKGGCDDSGSVIGRVRVHDSDDKFDL